ncbi:Alpha/beta hydrolase family protein [Promicromonospora umidemergens]|uniref:Alpha/beta hydrolase n=1 Tax=Promicromonospora umidemergens TaxID=629679 RepID=A0ABP8Y3Q0_9MICO|nr:S9 family peptidase [Promicromonospora umidemergens]MCP2284617.1 Alpha/beta hydrolase family protein [Promicromonospora umidemergens]
MIEQTTSGDSDLPALDGAVRHAVGQPGKAPLRVIFVPGLGDRLPPLVHLQREALRTWRALGVHTTMFRVRWSSDASFQDRLDRLDEMVERYEQRGERVALMGASAGAGAVLAAYARRRSIVAVVIIAGKWLEPEDIIKPVLERNAPFAQSLSAVPKLLEELGPDDRAKILSLRSARDGVVDDEDTLLEGAVNETMRVVGHVIAIGYALMFRARRVVRFLREATSD